MKRILPTPLLSLALLALWLLLNRSLSAGNLILGTVLDELERTGKQTALVSLCVAAGMGSAMVIERDMHTFTLVMPAAEPEPAALATRVAAPALQLQLQEHEFVRKPTSPDSCK